MMFAEEAPAAVKYNVAWIGIIGAVFAAIVSLISLFFTLRASRANQVELQKHQRELEELKTNLQQKSADRDARRDYEYDARKRLYQQCEPLLFQLFEHAESGRKRIRSLARTAKQGDLSLTSGEGWLHDPRNYYLESTLYKLLAPLVVFRIIQQKLTLVDLTVDPHINSLYLLSKRLFLSLTDDFKFAHLEPSLAYDPHARVSAEVMREQPARYARQGLSIGILETLIDKMIVGASGSERCMNYGEFAAAYCLKGKIADAFAPVAALFVDFHPKTRPVLWRLLVAQFHLYEALIQARELKISNSPHDPAKLLKPLADDQKKVLDWRSYAIQGEDDEVLVLPFKAAESYLNENLKELGLIKKYEASQRL